MEVKIISTFLYPIVIIYKFNLRFIIFLYVIIQEINSIYIQIYYFFMFLITVLDTGFKLEFQINALLRLFNRDMT